MASLLLGESRLPQLLKRANNMSQSEFARRLGVSRQFITKVIKKERKFSLEQALLAAHILDCDVNELYHYSIVADTRSE